MSASTNLPLRFLRPSWIFAATVLSMAGIGALAYWDELRESNAALEDYADEQAVIALGAADSLSSRLAAVRREAMTIAEDAAAGGKAPRAITSRYLFSRVREADAPASAADGRGFTLSVPASDGRVVDLGVPASDLFDGLDRLDQPGGVLVLLAAPGETRLRAVDGHVVDDPQLVAALVQGRTTLRVLAPHAATLGLPERTAVAGLARLDAGPLGRWGLAVVASAVRERDRERRARWRLLLAVMLAGGVVLFLGDFALRKQRKELQLSHELAVAELARERDERLERLSRIATLATLASGVAHEVSTPLGVIVGRAEQLAPRVKDDERASHAVRAIADEAERIRQVVQGFLRLARGGTPSLELVSPAKIVRSAMALVEHRFEKAGVRLVSVVPESLPPIGCDPRLLEHALVNLLLNACDASPRDSTVEAAVVSDGALVSFVVTDEGAGITATNAARATEPFFTTKPVGQGTGLGLAIANEIVKIHRGSLSIAPAESRGTRASLKVPLAGETHVRA